MSLVLYKAIAALLVFLVSFMTAVYPIRKKAAGHTIAIELGEALASGIFLGAAFFHMLPDSILIFNQLYGSLAYPVPEAICVSGFLFLLLLERISLTDTVTPAASSIPCLLAAILIIHALIEGAALGIGSTYSETVMLFIAILAHKGSESFALALALLRTRLPYRRMVLIVGFFALMTPLGIGIGDAINLLSFDWQGKLAAGIFNAVAAGTFLYISTLHHIHFHKHARDTQGLLEFISLVAGAGLMGVIAMWT